MVSKVQNKLTIPRKKLTSFCSRWKVQELSLFGSILRDDFRPDSDIDVLFLLRPGFSYSLFDLVQMEKELTDLFGRKVDLVDKNAVKLSENYIRRRNILENSRVIYAA